MERINKNLSIIQKRIMNNNNGIASTTMRLNVAVALNPSCGQIPNNDNLNALQLDEITMATHISLYFKKIPGNHGWCGTGVPDDTTVIWYMDYNR